jgi:hypothetical protein
MPLIWHYSVALPETQIHPGVFVLLVYMHKNKKTQIHPGVFLLLVYVHTSAYVSITRWLFRKLKSIKVSACVYIYICTCAKCQVGVIAFVVLHVMR